MSNFLSFVFNYESNYRDLVVVLIFLQGPFHTVYEVLNNELL